MITEVATIRILPGTQKQFEAAVSQAVEVFRRAEGCTGLHLEHCIEEPETYCVMIGWRSLEDHTVRFRNGELFQEWRALVGPYFAEAPSVSHYVRTMARVDFEHASAKE